MNNILNIILAILVIVGLAIFMVFSIIANNIDDFIKWLEKRGDSYEDKNTRN